ncbi:MAG TPA: hypothetical protein VLI05_01060 [Candidatus Saccharimonadia bacterium]|nr:hypothetical protein [Candidatus Saccharimonadia bacterium]
MEEPILRMVIARPYGRTDAWVLKADLGAEPEPSTNVHLVEVLKTAFSARPLDGSYEFRDKGRQLRVWLNDADPNGDQAVALVEQIACALMSSVECLLLPSGGLTMATSWSPHATSLGWVVKIELDKALSREPYEVLAEYLVRAIRSCSETSGAQCREWGQVLLCWRDQACLARARLTELDLVGVVTGWANAMEATIAFTFPELTIRDLARMGLARRLP